MAEEKGAPGTRLGGRYECAECGAQFIVVRPGNLPVCHSASLRPR
jgi:hypothetical protein